MLRKKKKISHRHFHRWIYTVMICSIEKLVFLRAYKALGPLRGIVEEKLIAKAIDGEASVRVSRGGALISIYESESVEFTIYDTGER